MKTIATALFSSLLVLQGAKPIDIGDRRELFVDQYLIAALKGDASRRLHHPRPREIAVKHDAPWEGAGSGYHTVIKDGDLYRMYHRGSALGVVNGRLKVGKQVYCYAESKDGINWTKPKLGLHEYNGSKDNNIFLTGLGVHNFAPFLDTNPNCKPEARFKALAGTAKEGGLFAFQSADGIRWKLMRKEPVVTEGAFDSQNLAFWDQSAGKYRAYFRTFTKGITTGKVWKPAGYRAIRTASSRDFLEWGDEHDLTYEDSPDDEHLYTNQVGPYYRAPHVLIGLPTRYIERGWSESMRDLPQLKHREMRSKAHLRYGTSLTETLVMASRDGVHFERWNEAFIRPGIQRPETWQYGQNYTAWHAVETKSSLPGAPNEISFYCSEGGWTGDDNILRRHTLRLDGFVSVRAGMKGGELITKPIIFKGNQLNLNFATSAAGSIRVAIETASGKPLKGYSLEDCPAHFGDTVGRPVTWKAGTDVSKLIGKPIRLRFELKDADLYSFKFANKRKRPVLGELKRIWDKGKHNAFTDLVRHDGRWYCVFREGSKHVSPDGALRVITSKDGDNWESLALVTHPDFDLRDAKLTVMPDGRFMLNGAGMQAEKKIRYHSMTWFSNDKGKTWSKENIIGDPGFWLWRAHLHDGNIWSFGYETLRDRSKRGFRLYRSKDGREYETVIPQLNVDRGVGEDRILFMNDGSALCLLRHETGNKMAFLGKAKPPFTEWKWQLLNKRIGGPNMIQLPDGNIIAVTRLYDRPVRTSLSWLDPNAGTLTECLKLPSGGDTSYAGLVWHEDQLWVSYYSSHEERTSIYLAKVRFD